MGKRKGGTPEEEIWEWIRRMIDDVEDFDFADTEEEWQQFLIDSGIVPSNPTYRQNFFDAWERGREYAKEWQEKTGLSYEPDVRGQHHHRDDSGRFISRDDASSRLLTLRILEEDEERASRNRGDR